MLTIINGKDVTFYRHLIVEFSISPTVEGDKRWKAYTFVRNVYTGFESISNPFALPSTCYHLT
jgi:hypothetical protein